MIVAHDADQPRRYLRTAISRTGSTNIRELASQYSIELPGDAGFETLAGFLLQQFGYIPAPGESVIYDGRTFIVDRMDRNRIARVKISNLRPDRLAS